MARRGRRALTLLLALATLAPVAFVPSSSYGRTGPPTLRVVPYEVRVDARQTLNWSVHYQVGAPSACQLTLNSQGTDFTIAYTVHKGIKYKLYFKRDGSLLGLAESNPSVQPQMIADQEREASLTRTYTGPLCTKGLPGDAPTPDCGKEVHGTSPQQPLAYDYNFGRLTLTSPVIFNKYSHGSAYRCPFFNTDTGPLLPLQTSSLQGGNGLYLTFPSGLAGRELLKLSPEQHMRLEDDLPLIHDVECVGSPGCSSSGHITLSVTFERLK